MRNEKIFTKGLGYIENMVGAMVKTQRLILNQVMLGKMNRKLRFRSKLISKVGSALISEFRQGFMA